MPSYRARPDPALEHCVLKPSSKRLYFIYTEIFASNFVVWKRVSDFTSTNQRSEMSSHVKTSFGPITKDDLSALLFRGHRAGSFVGQL